MPLKVSTALGTQDVRSVQQKPDSPKTGNTPTNRNGQANNGVRVEGAGALNDVENQHNTHKAGPARSAEAAGQCQALSRHEEVGSVALDDVETRDSVTSRNLVRDMIGTKEVGSDVVSSLGCVPL